MTITSVDQWSETADSNTDIAGFDIGENCSPAGINNAIRNLMAQVAATPLATSAATTRDSLDVPVYVATRTALKALDTTKDTTAILTESGREGVFIWRSGDYAARISADSEGGYFLKADAISSSSGSWVRVCDVLDLRHFGGDPTGSAASDNALNAARALQVITSMRIFIQGEFRMDVSKALGDDYYIFGSGIETARIVFNTCEGFSANIGAEVNRITMHDFAISQSGNWGGNNLTAIFLSDVLYSRFYRLRVEYHKYGIYMRRTYDGAAYRNSYFNLFQDIETFGCHFGITAYDNGATINKCTWIHIRCEDNGQRSAGYGMDIDGVGHTLIDIYGGLPSHTAALRLGPASSMTTVINVYGEGSGLTQTVKDDTAAGRDNVIIGVHVDGVPTYVTRASGASNAIYAMAGPATNVFPDRPVIVNKASTSSVSNASYDYMDFSFSGAAVGDTAIIVAPSGWPAGLIRGEPIVSSGSVRLAYNNNSGGSLSPPTGDYSVVLTKRV